MGTVLGSAAVSGQRQGKGSSSRSGATPRSTSDVRVEHDIYPRVNRDGTLGRFRAIGSGGVRRTFDTLQAAREMNVNVWDVVDDIKALVASPERPAPADLTDPDVPLAALVG